MKKRKKQPNVAIYLDDIDEIDLDKLADEYEEIEIIEKRSSRHRQQDNDLKDDEYLDVTDEYEEEVEEDGNHQTGRKKKHRKKSKKRMKENDKYKSKYEKSQRELKKYKKKNKKKRGGFLKSILAVILLLNVPMVYGIVSSFKLNTLQTKSHIKSTKGILLLGLDDWYDRDEIDGGHTDSITYLGANLKTKKAYTLPLYRDLQVNQTCSGLKENINRIYTQAGINCLTNSTSAFLDLPIDYYVIITMEGLISIVNHLGGVELTPSSSFCSNYGEDGIEYCFNAGETKKMKGPEALAYVRYRGASNGEQRANRQTELIMSIKNTCMSNIGACYVRVTPFLNKKLETNIPVTELPTLLKIFSNDFETEKLSVLQGTNINEEGGWTQIADEDDLTYKTGLIRESIFA